MDVNTANVNYSALRDFFVGTTYLQERKHEFQHIGVNEGMPLFPYEESSRMFWRALDKYVDMCIEKNNSQPIMDICNVIETKFADVLSNPNPLVMAVVSAMREARVKTAENSK